VSGGSFHAGRSSKDFGADLSDDSEVSGAFQRGIGIAGESNRAGTAVARELDGGESERSAATGSNADDDVVLSRLSARHFITTLLGVVLADLGVGG